MDPKALGDKPQLSFWQIWNMCFGFLGIQFGFALQNANVSRIFQTLGAEMDDIPVLWIAAPLTGLVVQPIVGYLSDRTWTGLGRRRPYFLVGAVLATLALFVMPESPVLWIGAGTLWVLDASINIAMEPFRAFVGDQLPCRQRPTGYAMQSFFIGVGSVVASLLPFLLAHFGVSNTAGPGEVPDTVRYAFWFGGAVLLLAVGWTVLRTREYPPEQLHAWDEAAVQVRPPIDRARLARHGGAWLGAGALLAAAVVGFALDRQLYILAGLLAAYGLAQFALRRLRADNPVASILGDLHHMPVVMRQLAVVQFFSWFALFAMWIYTTAAVTGVHFGSDDPTSAAYNEGANWVGVLFAAYNGFAALAAMVIPAMVRRLGLRMSHLVNAVLGGLGLLSFLVIDDPRWLLLSMVGVGFAWASILSLPYALLSDCLPAAKMGVYMGIFNFFIVIPQLVAASLLGFLLNTFLGGEPVNALAVGGLSLVVAGLCVLRVREPGTSGRAAPGGRMKSALPLALLAALAGGCVHVAAPAEGAAAPAAPAATAAHAVDYVGTTEPFAANAVYFVVTDRFVNGDPSNDQRDQGGSDPALRTFDRPTPGAKVHGGNIGYLGGDFRGLLDNAGYIADMGFGAVWLTPIVDNPDEAFTGGDPVGSDAFFKDRGKTGYHGYWGVNFFELDEHLPSPGLGFAGLTAGLRAHGLVTVLDIVANHGSPSFTMPVDQPKFGELYDADGTLVADHQNLAPADLDPDRNPLHAFFHDEPDLAQLSNLDDTRPAVLDYFVRAYSQWIDQGAGAFRIDTIRHVPHPFWKAFSDRIRARHPGFFMFGEAFDHEAANIAPHTWPENGGVSVLDFPLKAALQEVFGPAGAGFERLAGALYLVDGPYANPYELMTFYDNHDMPRMDADDAGFIDAHNWLFTARGIPVVYYGSETGFMRGAGEHAGNRNYFGQDRIDAAIGHPIHRQLVRIARVRATTPALQRGLQVNVELEGDRAAFYRVLQHGDQAQIALVLLNKGDAPAAFAIERYLQAGEWRDALDGGRFEVASGDALAATVPAHGVKVFVLDAPVRDAGLAAALDIAMAGTRRGD